MNFWTSECISTRKWARFTAFHKGFPEDLIPFNSYLEGFAEDPIPFNSYLKGFPEDLIPFRSYLKGIVEVPTPFNSYLEGFPENLIPYNSHLKDFAKDLIPLPSDHNQELKLSYFIFSWAYHFWMSPVWCPLIWTFLFSLGSLTFNMSLAEDLICIYFRNIHLIRKEISNCDVWNIWRLLIWYFMIWFILQLTLWYINYHF